MGIQILSKTDLYGRKLMRPSLSEVSRPSLPMVTSPVEASALRHCSAAELTMTAASSKLILFLRLRECANSPSAATIEELKQTCTAGGVMPPSSSWNRATRRVRRNAPIPGRITQSCVRNRYSICRLIFCKTVD